MQADIQKELRIEISLDCFDLFWQSFPLKLIWGYRFIEGASFMPRNVVHQIRIKDAENSEITTLAKFHRFVQK